MSATTIIQTGTMAARAKSTGMTLTLVFEAHDVLTHCS